MNYICWNFKQYKIYVTFRPIFIKTGTKNDDVTINRNTLRKSNQRVKKQCQIVNDSLLFSEVRAVEHLCKSCRSRIMLQNDYLLETIGLDLGENEPSEAFEIGSFEMTVWGGIFSASAFKISARLHSERRSKRSWKRGTWIWMRVSIWYAVSLPPPLRFMFSKQPLTILIETHACFLFWKWSLR